MMGWENLSGCQGLGKDFWGVDGERRRDGKKDKSDEEGLGILLGLKIYEEKIRYDNHRVNAILYIYYDIYASTILYICIYRMCILYISWLKYICHC